MDTRLLEFLRMIIPFLRPRSEIARRFGGRISWNELEINKQEVIHSISFKTSNWVELVGFEMLSCESSFKISFTITRGQGVLGKLVTKGRGYIPRGDILHPSVVIKLPSRKRIQPNTWYCINVIVDIHEYEMVLVTSGGNEGMTRVESDSGVVVDFGPGLESCKKTDQKSGQIAGVVFHRIFPDEEEYLASMPLKNGRRPSLSGDSQRDSWGDDDTKSADIPEVRSTTSSRAMSTRPPLPPFAGVMTPPIRTEEVLKSIPT